MAQLDDERSWVEGARTGDPEAVGLLYERYFDPIYRYIYLKIGNATEAEDLCEQVFLKMIEAIGAFQWQGSGFASWLYRIAHNQVVDSLRRRSRRPTVPIEPVGDSIVNEQDDPHREAEQVELRRHLVEAITDLTDLQAQVISLKFGSGLSNAEVAAILGKTEGAVKALQFAALQNLQKKLSQRGFSGDG